MTDDGGLIHHLLSPSHHVEKEYEVHCRDELHQRMLRDLKKVLISEM
jgi:16S rRNA pseudouridine516 synthase